MSKKLTEWFRISESGNPTRKGWYDVKYSPSCDGELRRYWTGQNWSFGPRSVKCGFGNSRHDIHREFWRGLAENPEK